MKTNCFLLLALLPLTIMPSMTMSPQVNNGMECQNISEQSRNFKWRLVKKVLDAQYKWAEDHSS